jgi:hypothetical protein
VANQAGKCNKGPLEQPRKQYDMSLPLPQCSFCDLA